MGLLGRPQMFSPRRRSILYFALMRFVIFVALQNLAQWLWSAPSSARLARADRQRPLLTAATGAQIKCGPPRPAEASITRIEQPVNDLGALEVRLLASLLDRR